MLKLLDISEMLHNPKTQLIQFTTEKVVEKVPWTIFTPD